MKRHIALMIVALSLISTLYAQTDKQPKIKGGGIVYDKFKDTSTVIINPMSIGSYTLQAVTGGLEIGATFTFPGQKIVKPEAINLSITSVSNQLHYMIDERTRRLNVLADVERIDLGTMSIDQAGKGQAFTKYSGSMVEIMIARVSYEQFSKIANAKKVEMQLGSKEFSLKDKHLETFRGMLAIIPAN